jgi:hypothetical protein
VTAQSTIDFRISDALRSDLQRWRKLALVVGAIGLAAMAAGILVFHDPFQFYQSYLWAFIFVLGLSTGPLVWLMLQYLTGGAWGVVIRRPAEAAARCLPLVLVLFLPIVIGINNLYPWAHPDVVAADRVLTHQAPYLNVRFFVVRAIVYFFGWLFLSYWFNRWSLVEDREGPAKARGRMTFVAGPGVIFWALSVTFMSIDWVLSLHSQWFSTMFGLLYMASQGLTSMAFLITLLAALATREPMSHVLTKRHFHDLGKLMFALTMVWAYFSYSQFLIIWTGNLPEEIPWYLARTSGGWGYVAVALVLFHFALPFSLLLSRDLKRNAKMLRNVAMFVLLMRLVDIFWQVTPYFYNSAFHVSWMDIAAPAGLIGIWLWYFFGQLEKRPLMPLHEPELEGALNHGRE